MNVAVVKGLAPIPRSPALAVLALLLSGTVHVVLMGWSDDPPPVRIAGGVSTPVGIEGISFEDLAGEVVTQTERAPVRSSTMAEPVTASTNVTRVRGAESPASTTVTSTSARPAPASTVSPARTSVAVTSSPVSQAGVAVTPSVSENTPEADMPVSPVAEDTIASVTPDVVAPASEPDDAAVVMASSRPQPRPETRVEPAPAQPAVVPARDPNPAPTAPQRTASVQSSEQVMAQPAQSAGNAAVSNYPGVVRRYLAQRGFPRGRATGVAQVEFTVAPNGSLAAVSLVRRSGSVEIDNAALSVVRRAAPYPTPPQGAQVRFTIPLGRAAR